MNDHQFHLRQKAGAAGIALSLSEQAGNKADDHICQRVCAGFRGSFLFQEDTSICIPGWIVFMVCLDDRFLVHSAFACL